MAAADAMAPVEPAVHPTDLGVRELNGAVVMVERKQVDIATKAALESRVAALNTASERADEALKASRSKLSVLLKSQQTLFQSLSKLGETLIATRADARDTKAL